MYRLRVSGQESCGVTSYDTLADAERNFRTALSYRIGHALTVELIDGRTGRVIRSASVPAV